MRLSEILKSETTATAPIAPIAPVKPAPKASPKPEPPAPPAPPPAAKAPVMSSQNIAAAIERAVAEARQDLEKEFQRQLDKMRFESQRSNEDQLREEEKKFFARTESWKKEKQQLASQMEDLRRENDSLKSASQQLEAATREISEARSKMAEEFQRKIAELEIQRQRNEAKSAAAPVAPPASAPPAPLDPPKISTPSFTARPAAPPPPPPVPEKQEAPIVFDPARTEKARDLYQVLLVWAQNFFEKARAGTIECSELPKIIERFIEHTDLHDDLILIAAEPYPAENYFSYHAVNSAILSVVLGNDLKMNFEDMRDLGTAGVLYDIGLLKGHENLDYPKQLSGQGQSEVMKHPEKGVQLLMGHVSEVILTAVGQHHELVNGKGYPQSLQGDDIHLFAKILSAVDSFEAMTHTRPYRPKPMEINQAVKEMIEAERGLYDRDVMKALLARVGLYPIRSLVELSNKQIARVLRQNRQFPLSPVVQIEFDESGSKLGQPHFLDLSRNQLVHIIGPVRSTPAYAKEQPVSQAKRPSPRPKDNEVNLLREALPLLIMAVILVVLVYLIVKI